MEEQLISELGFRIPDCFKLRFFAMKCDKGLARRALEFRLQPAPVGTEKG
jgi:hypothetical protein